MKGQHKALAILLMAQALEFGQKFKGNVNAHMGTNPMFSPTKSQQVKRRKLERQHNDC